MDEEMLEKLCEAYWNASTTVKTTWAGAEEEQRKAAMAKMRIALEYMETEGYRMISDTDEETEE